MAFYQSFPFISCIFIRWWHHLPVISCEASLFLTEVYNYQPWLSHIYLYLPLGFAFYLQVISCIVFITGYDISCLFNAYMGLYGESQQKPTRIHWNDRGISLLPQENPNISHISPAFPRCFPSFSQVSPGPRWPRGAPRLSGPWDDPSLPLDPELSEREL